jgi:hypothetical protein
MRRAVAALVVTAAAVVLLARFETEAPITLNPELGAAAARDAARARPAGGRAARAARRRGTGGRRPTARR